MFRLLALSFLVFGLSVSGLRAEEKKAEGDTHEGKLVKVDDNKLTMSDKEGKNEHTHTVSADTKVMCDGKECKLKDLKAGVMVKVTTKKGDKDTVVKVEASTKEIKKDEPKKDDVKKDDVKKDK